MSAILCVGVELSVTYEDVGYGVDVWVKNFKYGDGELRHDSYIFNLVNLWKAQIARFMFKTKIFDCN